MAFYCELCLVLSAVGVGVDLQALALRSRLLHTSSSVARIAAEVDLLARRHSPSRDGGRERRHPRLANPAAEEKSWSSSRFGIAPSWRTEAKAAAPRSPILFVFTS